MVRRLFVQVVLIEAGRWAPRNLVIISMSVPYLSQSVLFAGCQFSRIYGTSLTLVESMATSIAGSVCHLQSNLSLRPRRKRKRKGLLRSPLKAKHLSPHYLFGYERTLKTVFSRGHDFTHNKRHLRKQIFGTQRWRQGMAKRVLQGKSGASSAGIINSNNLSVLALVQILNWHFDCVQRRLSSEIKLPKRGIGPNEKWQDLILPSDGSFSLGYSDCVDLIGSHGNQL